MQVIPIVPMTKGQAIGVCGTVTQTTKMPCKSYSLPTVACITGFRMAQITGSICSSCYANKGNYKLYAANVEPAQHARLESINGAHWVSGMVALIGSDAYFRWHDSGDLQSIEHLQKIAQVCDATPNCKHWLPTREYAIVKAFIALRSIPSNLVIRLSAMYPDKPVIVPASLQGVPGIATSNVHQHGAPIGQACIAPQQRGECRDCRACWSRTESISYRMH